MAGRGREGKGHAHGPGRTVMLCTSSGCTRYHHDAEPNHILFLVALAEACLCLRETENERREIEEGSGVGGVGKTVG